MSIHPRDSMKDITKDLRPTEHLGVWIVRGLNGDWCDWVPEWAWYMHKEQAQRVARLLRDFGITDELVEQHRNRGVK